MGTPITNEQAIVAAKDEKLRERLAFIDAFRIPADVYQHPKVISARSNQAKHRLANPWNPSPTSDTRTLSAELKDFYLSFQADQAVGHFNVATHYAKKANNYLKGAFLYAAAAATFFFLPPSDEPQQPISSPAQSSQVASSPVASAPRTQNNTYDLVMGAVFTLMSVLTFASSGAKRRISTEHYAEAEVHRGNYVLLEEAIRNAQSNQPRLG